MQPSEGGSGAKPSAGVHPPGSSVLGRHPYGLGDFHDGLGRAHPQSTLYFMGYPPIANGAKPGASVAEGSASQPTRTPAGKHPPAPDRPPPPPHAAYPGPIERSDQPRARGQPRLDGTRKLPWPRTAARRLAPPSPRHA